MTSSGKLAGWLAALLFMAGSAVLAWHLQQGAYDDFPTFYWATWLAFHEGASAYQYAHFMALGEHLGSKIYPFLYPPPSTLLFSPLLLCRDYGQAKLVFAGFNVLLAWGLPVCLYRLYAWHARAPLRKAFPLLCLLLLVYGPLIDTFRTGQVNLLVLMCVMPLFFPLHARWARIGSGILLACAITLKVYVVVFLPVLLLFRRWPELLACTAALVLLILASLWLLPASLWEDWLALAGNSGFGKRLPHVLTVPFNQSVNGVFIRAFLDQWQTTGLWGWVGAIHATVGLLLLVTAGLVCRYLYALRCGLSVALALVLLLVNLVAPLTWFHHYILALPALLWAVLLMDWPGISRRCQWYLAPLLLVAFAGLAFPLLPRVLIGLWVNQPATGMSLGQNMMLSSPFLMAVLLFVVLATLIVKSRPAANPKQP
ncbi:MAG TPA: glycosyltransferase family 87 protein [Pseudomonadales bacterium]